MAQKEVAFKIIVDTEQVFPEIDNIKKEIEKLKSANEKMSEEIKNGFKAAEKSTKSLGTSIGGLLKSLGLIGLAMAVFEFMRDIVSKNQKVMDALNTATTALEIILYKIFDALEPIGNAMKAAFEDPKQAVIDLWEVIKENLLNRLEGIVMQFKALGTVIKSALDLDWDGVTEGAKDFASATVQVYTGLDEVQRAAALDGFKNFVDEVSRGTKEALNQAAALTALRNEVALLEARQRGLMLEYQNEAEIQRQIRDDISLTIAERIAANEELGRILEEQIQKEEAIAERRLELARAELATNESSIELQVALINAETELADVRERINGQRSEQLTNQKALEKELFDIQQQLRIEEAEERERELIELEQHHAAINELARLAGEEAVYTAEETQAALDALREKFRQDDAAKEKKANNDAIREAQRLRDAKISAASDLVGALGSISTSIEGQSKAAVAVQKTLAVAQIAIDTARSISGAIAAAQLAGPFPANIIAIATGVAAVVAGIASAVTTLNGANVPGPTAAPPPSATASISAAAPSFTPVTTNTTELGNTEAAELAPIQAFVVETQLTDTQFNIQQIEGQATFGADLGG